jgi:hypothetical protein
VTGLPAPYYFATAGNKWAQFHPWIPALLTPHDTEVINDFFRGNSTLYRWRVVLDWMTPVLFWTGIVAVIAWVMLCINTILRRPWVEGERLTFPLVYLPLEMCRGGGEPAFWKNRRMWAGFGLAGGLESINSLNYLYPTVPHLWLKAAPIDYLFTERPWNGLGAFALAFYPFMIGVAFLLSLDVSFSCWFLYLFTKAELIFATAMGWKDPGASPSLARAPYLGEQGAGAFIGLALFALWTARRHLLGVLRRALGVGGRSDADELMPYRTAIFGALGGIVILSSLLALGGMPPGMAVAFFLLYFLFMITITRIVVEAGAGWTMEPAFNPQELIIAAVGTNGLSSRPLMMLTYSHWIDLDYRDSAMPQQLQGMKMAQAGGIPPRALLAALMVAAVLGALAAFWANLHIYYENGAATAKSRQWITSVGQAPFRQLRVWLDNPLIADWSRFSGVTAGLSITAILGLARQRFAWWPLHPIGYAVANTGSLNYMWMPFFIAWILKSVVLRYGGMQLYRACIPFALGLILGDYVIPILWSFWGALIGQQMYMSFPH